MRSTEKVTWALAGMFIGFSTAVLFANAVLVALVSAELVHGAAHLLFIHKGA